MLLEATGIVKRFEENSVLANDHAELRVAGGSVHAIVGDNGAGKSTLMHIIAGTVQPDAGTITLRGEPLPHRSPTDALAAGVVISFQHPRLVPSLTVWENLVLGAEPKTLLGTVNRKAAKDSIRRAAFHPDDIDIDIRADRLSSGQARLVSLMAALMRLPADRPGVLILDEPTAACGPVETQQIITAVRHAAAAGHGVIYISHKISEITQVADRVTVMRDGASTATLEPPFSARHIASIMLEGRSDVARAAPRRTNQAPNRDTAAFDPGGEESGRVAGEFHARPVLEVSDLSLSESGRKLLVRVSFAVEAGTILGLTGVRQSGLEAIEEVLGGVRRPTTGSVILAGRDVTGLSPRALRKRGVGYVPTDRLLRGASLESSVAENLIVLERKQLQRAGVFLQSEVDRFGRRLTEEFDIDATLHLPLNRLSGGNIQKVILSREIAEGPRLLIVCEPSWGLDIPSRRMIAQRIRAAADSGAAVVLISTDLEEVLEFADEVAAFHAGRLSEIVPVSQTSARELGYLVFGSRMSGSRHA